MSSRSFDKRIRFVLDLCQGAIIMRGDPSNIENALLNLACNARDAMPEGGDIVFRTRMISNETVRIEVEDSGVGMPQSVLRHLFEPFFSTKGEFGNGLGMAAVYGAIKTHNGNIEVESVEGKGTKVIIDLPIVTVPSVDETEIGVVRAPYAANVLVVDDEESVRDMLKSVLGMLGYSAVFASTAAEAVKRYEDNCLNVDFVLLDVVLPDGTGTTVFNELVKINPKVKAVVMSGYTGSHLDESLVQRAFALVNKPFAVGELSQAMARCLVS
jgi:CheY-like chemotaxis protein